jgi:hypothetical protein
VRLCPGGWIESYLDYTKTQESPEIFHFWIAVSVLAATLGRNVWIDREQYKLYPNHYVIILAGSAVCRKSIAVKMGNRLLGKAEITNGGAEKITNAALWLWLHEEAERTGKSEIFIFSDELGLSLNKEEATKGVIQTLTRFYTCDDYVKNKTKISGVDEVRLSCVNILAATTPKDLAEIIPISAMGTGFTSRLHIIYAKSARFRRAKLTRDKELEAALVNDLQHIRQLSGEMIIQPDAWDWWENWYEKEYDSEVKGDGDEGIDSFHARKQDHILKLGIVLSLAKQDLLVVTKDDLMRSYEFVTMVEKNLPNIYGMIGKVPSANHADRILNQLRNKGGEMRRSELTHANWSRLSAGELDEVMKKLVNAHDVIAEFDNSSKTTIYKLKGDQT